MVCVEDRPRFSLHSHHTLRRPQLSSTPALPPPQRAAGAAQAMRIACGCGLASAGPRPQGRRSSAWQAPSMAAAQRKLRPMRARAAPLRPLLIDNYDSYTYNLYQIVAEVYGVEPLVLCNDACEVAHIQHLLAAGDVHHIILSPGPGSPDTPEDIGVCMDILRECTATPLLGVCLGHQALACAAGARVVRAPEPVHGRISSLQHSGHELFAGCPSGPGSGFDVVRYHSLVVDAAELPSVLEPLAWTCGSHQPVPLQQQQQQQQQLTRQPPAAAAAAAGAEQLLMAVRHRHRPHFGVQFHPESVATRHGVRVLLNFRDMAYRHSGTAPPPHLCPPRLGLALEGPPGRALPVRMWPATTSDGGGSCSSSRGGSGSSSSSAYGSDSAAALPEREPVPSKQAGESLRLGPSGCLAETQHLQLSWLKLEGQLDPAGGSQALFEAVVGAGAPDSFWLDSSSAPERGRFSFMGGRPLGGPLWHAVTYKLPPAAEVARKEQRARQCGGGGGDSSGLAAACGRRPPPPGLLRVTNAQGRVAQQHCSVWDYLQQQLAGLRLEPGCAQEAAAALPFDFWGGFVGVLGYELKSECGATAAHDAPTPDAAWLFADRLLVADHAAGDVYLLALTAAAGGEPGAEPALRSARRWLSGTAASIRRMVQQHSQQRHGRGSSPPVAVVAAAAVEAAPPPREQWPHAVGERRQQQLPPQQPHHQHRQQQQEQVEPGERQGGSAAPCPPAAGALLRHSRAQYLANVASCHEALAAGESYELCLTSAFTLPRPPPSWEFYTSLRRLNPAPYAAWLSVGAAGGAQGSRAAAVTVCCSSPERFLRGGRGGLLEARPIKGTAARVPGDAAADAAAATALAGSEKDRAENLMIADLLRNDLGRVCEPGSVHVPALMQLESFATVHQLVSTVRGLRRRGASCVEAIRAAFPGGSMTGAPKLRSMAILDELEGAARGVYSGALGYLSVNDTFDLNIVIRTAVYSSGAAGAGGQGSASGGAGAGDRRSVAGEGQQGDQQLMTIGAGGAIVVQSDAEAEFAEMQLKALQLLRTAQVVQRRHQQSAAEATAG